MRDRVALPEPELRLDRVSVGLRRLDVFVGFSVAVGVHVCAFKRNVSVDHGGTVVVPTGFISIDVPIAESKLVVPERGSVTNGNADGPEVQGPQQLPTATVPLQFAMRDPVRPMMVAHALVVVYVW